MTATYPKVQFFKQNNPVQLRPGIAGKVAVIGAFKNPSDTPVFCNGLDDAYAKLGNDDTYNGCAVLEDLFVGANSILAVNVTTVSGNTVDKTLTTQKLTDALAKIKNEKFDSIFIAELLTDEFLPILTTFFDNRLLNKLPCGLFGSVTRNTLADYTTTAGLFKDYSYGIVTQQLEVNGTELSLLKTGAYWAGVVSGINVGNSMTKKQVPNVTGVTPEYVFETVQSGISGLDLMGLGYTTFECFDRENDVYLCVNSEQFNGYDLYVNRVRDYVIREMALHTYLGERNTPKTLGEVEQELDRVKNVCVKTLDLLEDIQFYITKKDAKCVDVHITKLLFAGIITEIDAYFTIEVQ